jgi:hypothetical protein
MCTRPFFFLQKCLGSIPGVQCVQCRFDLWGRVAEGLRRTLARHPQRPRPRDIGTSSLMRKLNAGHLKRTQNVQFVSRCPRHIGAHKLIGFIIIRPERFWSYVSCFWDTWTFPIWLSASNTSYLAWQWAWLANPTRGLNTRWKQQTIQYPCLLLFTFFLPYSTFVIVNNIQQGLHNRSSLKQR